MARCRPATFAPPPDSITRRFEVAHTPLDIGGRHYELLRPRSVDDLISEEDFAIDERLPYWADCWPSSLVLAQHLAAFTGNGRSLLELGCGVGLVSLVAAACRFSVLATDYDASALEFTAANASRHHFSSIDTRRVDWRRLPDDLGCFDVVIASDVLYERPQAELVAATLARTLAPGGMGLIADPGRRTAAPFAEQCRRHALACRCAHQAAIIDGQAELTISVFEIHRI
ncbi:MAG: methyltransferase domain-containing protein [Planctomycetota bacterium]|nr:MAG: methyltransferase domain-containing protein [Planctomycetota bacterium]